MEQQLADIWRGLLGVSSIGIHDNFFHCGGHSLLATQLVSRMSQLCDEEISVKTIFNNPTIAQLCNLIVESTDDLENLEDDLFDNIDIDDDRFNIRS